MKDSDGWLRIPGAVVLSLAGGGCSPKLFDAVASTQLRWHALDWCAGQGPFDPESVAGRLGRALAERRHPTILAGHSLGGFISLLAALRFPAHVQGLVISNTGAHTGQHGDNSLPDRVRHHWTDEAQAAFLAGCFLKHPPEPLWSELRRYLNQLPATALLQAVEGLRRMDLRSSLSGLACPTLIAHGGLDRRRSPVAAWELARGITKAQLVMLPGGHTPMVDCAVHYRAVVGRFLAGLGYA
jgi:pimeloyl-ACP methyl ester carboxylesterase